MKEETERKPKRKKQVGDKVTARRQGDVVVKEEQRLSSLSDDHPVDHLSGSTASDGLVLELQLGHILPVPVLTLPRVSASDPD